MIISVASGKGGTGKTTVTLLLAASRPQVTVVDCDVEEPNCHLFLKPEWSECRPVTIMVPELNAAKCSACGRCSLVCMFNAIAMGSDCAMLFDDLCHSCGGCLAVCPAQAWTQAAKTIGEIKSGNAAKAAPGQKLISGQLKIGVPNAGPLIKSMLKTIPAGGNVLIDCPPGTSCSMVAGVTGSDYCVLVTEPTPFGKHDLALAVGITKLLAIPAGVVINKSDGSAGDKEIMQLCEQEGIPVIGKIPHSLDFAEKYSQGIIAPEYQEAAGRIWQEIERQVESV